MNAEVKKGPKACTTCAKAKSRCIAGPLGSGKCERCHRLHKPCSSQTPAPPRAKKEPRPTKVAELEKRLDQLTSQLNAAQMAATTGTSSSAARPNSVAGSPPTPSTTSISLSDRGKECEKERERERERAREARAGSGSSGGERRTSYQTVGFSHLFPLDAPPGPMTPDSESSQSFTSPTTSHHLRQYPPPSSYVTTTSRTTAATTPVSEEAAAASSEPIPLWPGPEEASAMLVNYRARKTALFPFILVPEHMTEAELRTQRPFLWKGVMLVECFLDGKRQMAIGAELLEEIGVAALKAPKKGVDLVHGVLLMIAWLHFDLNGFQLTNLLFLARSLCVNLRGNKDPGVYDAETLECMRAFAGCYYLNSVTFATNKRQDVQMSTTYLETCLRAISTTSVPTDPLLVSLVKTQILAQSISFTLDVDPQGNLRNTALQQQLPLAMVVQSFQSQLDALRSSVPADYVGNPALDAHFSVAEMLLYAVAIPDSAARDLSVQERLGLLWRCVQSAKAFLLNRFRPEGRDLENPRFICLSAHDFVYSCQLALKLNTLKAVGWDLAVVRRELDLVWLMEMQIELIMLIISARNEGPYTKSLGAQPGKNDGATGNGRGRGGVKEPHQKACWAGAGQEVPPFERYLVTMRGFRDTWRAEREKGLDAPSSGASFPTPCGDVVDAAPTPTSPNVASKEISPSPAISAAPLATALAVGGPAMGPTLTPPAEGSVMGLEAAGAGVVVPGEVDFFQEFQDFFLQTNSLEFPDFPLEQWGY